MPQKMSVCDVDVRKGRVIGGGFRAPPENDAKAAAGGPFQAGARISGFVPGGRIPALLPASHLRRVEGKRTRIPWGPFCSDDAGDTA